MCSKDLSTPHADLILREPERTQLSEAKSCDTTPIDLGWQFYLARVESTEPGLHATHCAGDLRRLLVRLVCTIPWCNHAPGKGVLENVGSPCSNGTQ
jgi:hypothetical protein